MQRPKKPCAYQRCPNLTRDRYCEEHQQQTKEDRKVNHQYYDKYYRDKEAAAFYKSKQWVRLREQAITRDLGLCQICMDNKVITIAEMVDHIIPIRMAWEYRLDINNLQSLCNKCHAIKTAEDKRKYYRN